MSGASRRSSSRSTTSTPPAQCASPVPETVIPTSSTLGDERRNARATRSSPATSVSIRSGRRASGAGHRSSRCGGRRLPAAMWAEAMPPPVAATSFQPAWPSSSRRPSSGRRGAGLCECESSPRRDHPLERGHPPAGTCPGSGVQTSIVVRIDLTSCTRHGRALRRLPVVEPDTLFSLRGGAPVLRFRTDRLFLRAAVDLRARRHAAAGHRTAIQPLVAVGCRNRVHLAAGRPGEPATRCDCPPARRPGRRGRDADAPAAVRRGNAVVDRDQRSGPPVRRPAAP